MNQEKILKSKQLNITYREINNWYEKGLIPFDLPPNIWHRFTFNEACWVKFIHELRSVGLRINSIRHFKKSILDYSEIIDESVVLFINKDGDSTINYDDEEKIIRFMQSPYITIDMKSIINKVNEIIIENKNHEAV